jgi:cytochrome c peroxidase
MLVMVHRINEQDFGVKDFKGVKVTCFTCHRGILEPLTAPVDPPTPVTAPPAPAPTATERG